MKIDLNFDLVSFNGQPVLNENGESIHAGQLLANFLVQQTKGDSEKFWELGKKLFNKEIVDLDSTDVDMLKDVIEESEFFAFIKAQLLEKFK